jgi:hypothetical protein
MNHETFGGRIINGRVNRSPTRTLEATPFSRDPQISRAGVAARALDAGPARS